MQLDVYRRHEPAHKMSFLVVPAGQEIPQEVTSTEWVAHARGVELDESSPTFSEYGIDQPARQLREKRYAITSLSLQPEDIA